jgi:hypothetical protein
VELVTGSTESYHLENWLEKGQRTWCKTDFAVNKYNFGERYRG